MTTTYSDSAIEHALGTIAFDEGGLVPAIAQQHETGEMLMMAWMNREAVTATLRTGEVHYYSRSRKALWRKGETSGQTQKLVQFRIDCDGDTVLVLVDQSGVACHTGRHNCFFNQVSAEGVEVIAEIEIDPKRLYAE